MENSRGNDILIENYFQLSFKDGKNNDFLNL